MAKVFILEDDASRMALFWEALEGHDITAVNNADDACEKFNGPYDLALLDHDLGGRTFVLSEDRNTGYRFSQWLRENDTETPVIVHSMNMAGALRMVGCLGPRAIWEPFGSTLLRHLQDNLQRRS